MENKNAETDLSHAADKMRELLHCGNERVELSAAKELMALAEAESANEKENEIRLEVNIKIAGD